MYSLVATDTSVGAWYHLGLDGDELAVGPDAGDLVDQLLFAVSAAAFACAHTHLLVHAGAVVAPDGTAVLLPGPSGAGKTTLVAGLVRAGFGYLSDEAGAIDPATLCVHAFARPLGLKGEARTLLRGPGWTACSTSHRMSSVHARSRARHPSVTSSHRATSAARPPPSRG